MTADGKTLLIVDDNKVFRERLGRAMESRGYTVTTTAGVAETEQVLENVLPYYAVVDLRLEDGNGLDLVAQIRKLRPESRIVVLTGYGNIATAVTAIKAGAIDYLPKPADADDVEAALLSQGKKASPPEEPMSANRVRWEHIQRVYELCDRNVSETARRLKMHRRTLQRILAKHSPQ